MNNVVKNNTPQAVDLAVLFIKQQGSYRNFAYKDTYKGWELPTIGYGTTKYADGTPVKRGDTITLEKAESALNGCISRSAAKLQIIPGWDYFLMNEKASLFSFAFCLGCGFYGSKNFSHITVLLNTYPHISKKQVLDTFSLYDNNGLLLNRRVREAALFCDLNYNLDHGELLRLFNKD